ncbi:MAG: TaqI-like C-terminal specificity domain-containing protein, partial [Bacteroidota bacterium]
SRRGTPLLADEHGGGQERGLRAGTENVAAIVGMAQALRFAADDRLARNEHDARLRDRLIAEHPSSADVLKPYLRGRDVKRWGVEYADQYLVKIESSENISHPWSGRKGEEAEKIFENSYPAIYSYFKHFHKRLIDRDDQGKYYWELRSCAYLSEFNESKIAWGNLATAPQFTFVESGYCINAPATFVVSKSHFLLALLNSRVTQYLVSKNAAGRQGGFLEYKPMYIAQVHVPSVAPEQQAEITRLVKAVLHVMKNDANADVTTLDREIDEIIYELYGLTKNEIAIIEDSITAIKAVETSEQSVNDEMDEVLHEGDSTHESPTLPKTGRKGRSGKPKSTTQREKPESFL